MEQGELRWSAPEFLYRHKTPWWYWKSMAVALLFLAFSVWQKNFLFSFFIVLAEILIIVWGNRGPLPIEFAATDKGLHIGETKFYDYSRFTGFSVTDKEDGFTLFIFQTRRNAIPYIKIRVPDEKVADLMALLHTKLTLVHHEESFLEIMEDFFGF